jgi:hypothetical protein
MSDDDDDNNDEEESYEYEYDDDMEEDEGGFDYTDDEQDAEENDGQVILGTYHHTWDDEKRIDLPLCRVCMCDFYLLFSLHVYFRVPATIYSSSLFPVENAYYNAKGLREDDIQEAIHAFEQVIVQEQQKLSSATDSGSSGGGLQTKKYGEWSYKSMKQLVKLHLRSGNAPGT